MNPTIRHFMKPLPHTIGIGRTLADAHQLMREHRIRHLPVLEHGKLVGIVTERDLHLLETLNDVDPKEVTVEEAMSPDVFAVGPNASLANVARVMAERKYGSAVVVSGADVLGIFTAIDSLRILADLARAGFFTRGREGSSNSRLPGVNHQAPARRLNRAAVHF